MKSFSKIRMVLFLVAIAANQVSVARAAGFSDGLYGWTRDPDTLNGNVVDFLSISTTSGQATKLFEVSIPAGYQALSLTYNPNGNFYGILRSGTNVRLAEITPTHTTNIYNYSGEEFVSPPESIEFSKDEAGLILSGGDTLYRVSTFGEVTDVTPTLGALYDQDVLAANSFGGELHVIDSNNVANNGNYAINKWNAAPGPFSPLHSVTGVYNGPVSNLETDVAVNPFTNMFYVMDTVNLSFFDMVGQSEVLIGPYNYPGSINGIAYVPEPSCLALAGLGFILTVLGRRPRRPV